MSMDTFVDFYELLHVQPSAPVAVIKASYRTMLQKLNHHPDRGGDVAFAQLLNRAAETLCKPDTRKLYDSLRMQYLAERRHGNAGPQADDSASGFSWGEPGGSPDSAKPDSAKPDSAEDDTAQRGHAPGEHGAPGSQTSQRNKQYDVHQNGAMAPRTSLPAKAHCLFCLTPSTVGSRMPANGYNRMSRCSGCNGASTPIEQLPRASNDELRQMHRQHHVSTAQLWTEWPAKEIQQSKLADFSPMGCALTNSGQLAIERVVMIETSLFNAICEVRYCHRVDAQTCNIGLSFLTLDMQAAPGSFLEATA